MSPRRLTELDAPGVYVLGRLVTVHPGQVMTVASLKTGEESDIFVMDPEPFRGHEGEIIGADFNLGFMVLPELLG